MIASKKRETKRLEKKNNLVKFKIFFLEKKSKFGRKRIFSDSQDKNSKKIIH